MMPYMSQRHHSNMVVVAACECYGVRANCINVDSQSGHPASIWYLGAREYPDIVEVCNLDRFRRPGAS